MKKYLEVDSLKRDIGELEREQFIKADVLQLIDDYASIPEQPTGKTVEDEIRLLIEDIIAVVKKGE